MTSQWFKRLAVFVLIASAGADASPRENKTTLAGLFRAGANKLQCVVEGSGPSEVACTIDHVATKKGIRYSRLACTGKGFDEMHADLKEPFETALFAGTAYGVWRAGTAGKLDLKQPAWLAIPPAPSHWQENDDPDHYSGTQHFTRAHDSDWCAAWWPFGLGGAPKAYAICVSPDGALTGIAAIKTEGRTWSIRCGAAPEPESLLPSQLTP